MYFGVSGRPEFKGRRNKKRCIWEMTWIKADIESTTYTLHNS